MSSPLMEINHSSWPTVAKAFDEASGEVRTALSDVVTQTTDSSACGAATGLASVDGAVAIMLDVFREVMQNTVVKTLSEGLAGEGEALAGTGKALRAMEDGNTDLASGMGAGL